MTSTSAAENAALASEYFVAVMNDNEFDETVLSEDYVAHMGSRGSATLEEIKANMARGHEAFPDRSVVLEDVVATDEDAVLRWRMTGTHEGPFMGIEPTGAAIDVVGFIQFEIEDGRIVEAWNLGDQLALFEQLGVVEPLMG